MIEQTCPLEEGDRVDHRVFGVGTVVDAPVAMVGPDMSSPTGVSDRGWRVRVKWDDPERSESSVASWALRKLSFADSHPFAYWDRQWQQLRQAWLDARREVELHYITFRPTPDQHRLSHALKSEAEAMEAIQTFLAEDAARIESQISE